MSLRDNAVSDALRRSAHATLREAQDEAVRMHAADGRERAVWFVRAVEAVGFMLPDRYIVGLWNKKLEAYPPGGGVLRFRTTTSIKEEK